MTMDADFFPEPLTLIEEFFLLDDFPNYPDNFLIRIRCRGHLPRSQLEESLRHCLRKHPLFDAYVTYRGRNPVWERATNQELPVEIADPKNFALPLLRQLDPHRQRLWSIDLTHRSSNQDGPSTEVILQIHHALCDGLGAIQFLSDLGRTLELLESDREIPRSSFDATQFRLRGSYRQSWKQILRSLPHSYRSILASMKLIFLKVDSLVPVASFPAMLEQKRIETGYRRLDLESDLSAGLRRRCRQANVTVNTAIAAEMFRSIAEWKKEQGHACQNNLRMIMPFNERSATESNLPACNRISISPITFGSSVADQVTDLRRRLSKSVWAVKKYGLGANFHRGLWICKKLMGGLQTMVKTDRAGATFLFTNVGNLFGHLRLPIQGNRIKCGPVLIEDVDLVPPLRVGTSFAAVLHDFNGETRLGIHYDSIAISSEQATGFCERLNQRLHDVAYHGFGLDQLD